MTTSIEKLRAISAPIGGSPIVQESLPAPLRELFPDFDGMVAFYRALLVIPPSFQIELEAEGLVGPFLTGDSERLFAFDIFGSMFVATARGIVRVDPETRDRSLFAETIELWAARILSRPNLETGFQLAQKWQLANRPLRNYERLLPKQPFVMGGDFVADNLVASDLKVALRLYTKLSEQLAKHQDGVSVSVEGWTP